MSVLNKITDPIAQTRLGILSEWSIRICLAWVFFEYGLPKFSSLVESPSTPLGFILKMDFFSSFPIISSWLIAIAEVLLIPLFIILGGLNFLGPISKSFSTVGGILGTFVMIVIIWGFHFPILDESFSDIHLQMMLLAMSLYFLFK